LVVVSLYNLDLGFFFIEYYKEYKEIKIKNIIVFDYFPI
jgi:hypothetical protein